MIQSGIIDSYMDIKETAKLFIDFAAKRLAEISGLILFFLGLALFIALFTYSPEDPNFIFPDATEINNLFGFKGSFVSDLLFQSVGLIAYLISLTFIITGINILRSKEFILIIENIFFTVFYCIFGTLFLTHYYSDAFTLYINGNGGFVGSFLNQTYLNQILLINSQISYYFLIILILFLFLKSINFNLFKFYELIFKSLNFFKKEREKNYTDKSEIISEYIPQEEIRNLIQEDLPFIKAENKADSKIKFKLPSLELLKIPSKKERQGSENKENNDPEFLEKILLDFGVDGKIKGRRWIKKGQACC